MAEAFGAVEGVTVGATTLGPSQRRRCTDERDGMRVDQTGLIHLFGSAGRRPERRVEHADLPRERAEQAGL